MQSDADHMAWMIRRKFIGHVGLGLWWPPLRMGTQCISDIGAHCASNFNLITVIK